MTPFLLATTEKTAGIHQRCYRQTWPCPPRTALASTSPSSCQGPCRWVTGRSSRERARCTGTVQPEGAHPETIYWAVQGRALVPWGRASSFQGQPSPLDFDQAPALALKPEALTPPSRWCGWTSVPSPPPSQFLSFPLHPPECKASSPPVLFLISSKKNETAGPRASTRALCDLLGGWPSA